MAKSVGQKLPLNLYLHFPFCQRKCHYCGFFSKPGQEKYISSYCEALKKEIQSLHASTQAYELASIYIGGGTPSLIDPEELEAILSVCRQTFAVNSHAEISIEANPESLTKDKVKKYLNAGIHRVSIGVQAWQPELLSFLGRSYTVSDVIRAYTEAREAGCTNVNLDLIFGIPGQTITQWQESLDNVIRLNPDHISCYSLEIDNQSTFGALYRQGKLKLLDEKLDRAMYHLACARLKEAGFQQYEISNFAKPQAQCRHNTDFWNYHPYIGCGAAAFSFFEGVRYNNIFSIEGYVANINSGQSTIEHKEALTLIKQYKESLMLGLRLNKGIDIQHVYDKYRINILQRKRLVIETLIKRKLIKIAGNQLTITEIGRDILDDILVEIL